MSVFDCQIICFVPEGQCNLLYHKITVQPKWFHSANQSEIDEQLPRYYRSNYVLLRKHNCEVNCTSSFPAKSLVVSYRCGRPSILSPSCNSRS